MLEAAILVIFPMCLALGAMTDLISMTIPNRVSILLAASFCIIAPLTGMDMSVFGWHFIAAGCVFVFCFISFAFNAMGGGDAKILSASALWYGFSPDLILYLIYIAVFGAGLTFLVLMLRANSNMLLATRIPMPLYVYNATAGVPYGVAIGIAALITFPDTALFTYALGG